VDEWRAMGFERLRRERFDMLVVGGGIVGAGVAELAARQGFKVALGERDDFARRVRRSVAGDALVGATDTSFDGDARDVRPTDADERRSLEEVALAVDRDALAAVVRARFAGVRVLPAGAVDTVRARRETTFSQGRIGMLSVAGGKLTTYRRIALAELHALRSELALHRIDRRPQPLPGAATRPWPRMSFGAAIGSSRRRWQRISRPRRGRSRTKVVASGPLEPFADGVTELEAQVLYAREREWALTADDVLRRRTTLALTGRDSDAVRARIETLLAS
jgi:glycerol-3-phosphate dehydrogenase